MAWYSSVQNLRVKACAAQLLLVEAGVQCETTEELFGVA